MWRRILITMATAIAFFNLAACNTVAGFGKDVEKVGEKINEKATR